MGSTASQFAFVYAWTRFTTGGYNEIRFGSAYFGSQKSIAYGSQSRCVVK